MAAREKDRKDWLLAVVLAGTTGLATSLGGVLAASAAWVVGPVLGIGAIISFIFFVRTGPAGRLIVVAGIGLAFAVLSIAIPGFLLYVDRFAGD